MNFVIQPHIRNKPERRWYFHVVLPTTVVAIIIYFDTFNHYWFLKLVGGYVIKVWLLPAFLFLFFLCRTFLQGNLNFRSKNIYYLNIFLILYFLFGLASLFFHEKLWNIGKFSLIMFGPLMLYACIINGFRKNTDIERIFKLLFLVGLIFALYSIYLFHIIDQDQWGFTTIEQSFMLSDFKLEFDPYNYSGFFIGEGKDWVRRTSIQGVDEVKFGGMLGPLVLVGFYYALNSKKYLKIFFYISTLVLFYAVISTLSRSATVALIIGLLFFLYHHLRYKRRKIMLAIGTLVLVISIFLLSEGAIDRLLQLLSSIDFIGKSEFMSNLIANRSIYVREEGHVQSYFEAIKILREAPFFSLLGIGVQNFQDIFAGYSWGVPHSRYVYILCTTGFLTLIPYVGFILMLILSVRRALLNRLKIQCYISNIGVILYPAVLLLAIKINNEGMETYYYWIFFGLATAWIRNLFYDRENANIVN